VAGSWDYAVKAAGWCKTHGIQVMMDLHGAPGSQVSLLVVLIHMTIPLINDGAT